MSDWWQGKTVLLTGGSGYFGRAFLAYAIQTLDVRSVRVFSRDEHKHHAMRQDGWSDSAPDSRVTYCVGDVRDKDRLVQAAHGADVIVHAAALKRVEGGATHARELIKTNVLGTANVVDAALACAVPRTVVISSDKAAYATNAYGKTKALAEELAVEGNLLAGGRPIRLCAVRYGNVLGSTGSVLGIWREAATKGQALSVTHLSATRFWMTVAQAVQVVAWAAETMNGGEIFVPCLSSSTLADLAQAAFPEHPLDIVGERAGGEKEHETLLTVEEARHTSVVDGPMGPCCVIEPQSPVWDRHRRWHGPARGPFGLDSRYAPSWDSGALRQAAGPWALEAGRQGAGT